MTAGYLLALPATAVLLLGYVRMLVLALRDPDPGRRTFHTLVAAMVFVVGYSLVQATVVKPIWGGGRAGYALSLVVPAALCGGLGFSALDEWLEDRGWLALRVVFYGWLGAFAAVVALSYAG